MHNSLRSFFFFNDTATTEIYTLSLHDALPIYSSASTTPSRSTRWPCSCSTRRPRSSSLEPPRASRRRSSAAYESRWRSEEHTSELQSRQYLVCRLLLEKKKK